MNNDLIEEGDKVMFEFENLQYISGVVLYTPVATGDSFHVRDENGKLRYVQNCCIVTLIEKEVKP